MDLRMCGHQPGHGHGSAGGDAVHVQYLGSLEAAQQQPRRLENTEHYALGVPRRIDLCADPGLGHVCFSLQPDLHKRRPHCSTSTAPWPWSCTWGWYSALVYVLDADPGSFLAAYACLHYPQCTTVLHSQALVSAARQPEAVLHCTAASTYSKQHQYYRAVLTALCCTPS